MRPSWFVLPEVMDERRGERKTLALFSSHIPLNFVWSHLYLLNLQFSPSFCFSRFHSLSMSLSSPFPLLTVMTNMSLKQHNNQPHHWQTLHWKIFVPSKSRTIWFNGAHFWLGNMNTESVYGIHIPSSSFSFFPSLALWAWTQSENTFLLCTHSTYVEAYGNS